MARRRPASIRNLRGALLLIFLLLVVGLVTLFQFGRSGQPSPGEVVAEAHRVPTPGGREFTIESEGFDHAVTDPDGRVVFEIEAERFQRDREKNVYLQGVTIRAEREEGSYLFSSLRAQFREESREARLEGKVEVEGPRGLRLWCDWLELQHGGRLVVASPGTRFAFVEPVVDGAGEEGSAGGYWERLWGTAQKFNIDLDREALLLGGGVEIHTGETVVPSGFLTAGRVEILQKERTARALHKVVVGRGGDRLEARRLVLFFDESMTRVEELRARWGVRVVLDPSYIRPRPSSETSTKVFLAGQMLLATTDVLGEPKAVRLTGLRRIPASIRWVGEGLPKGQHGSTRTPGAEPVTMRSMTAVRIDGFVENGQLTRAVAHRHVEIKERWTEGGKPRSRHLLSDRAEAILDAEGQLVRLIADGQVFIRDAELEATADQANFHLPTNRLDLLGKPNAVLVTDRGRLTAPEISFNQASGLLHAVPRVRSTIEADGAGVLSGALGGAEGPIQVESGEAMLRRGSNEFLFRGAVRAWQGRNSLFADQLRGQEGSGKMAASGNVKTLWFPEEETLGAAAGESLGAGGEESEPAAEARSGPVEIDSDLLTYDQTRREGALHYEGNVVVLLKGTRIDCDDLRIDLDEKGGTETMFFTGSFVLRDSERAVEITGDRAVYSIRAEVVRVLGEPLTVIDPRGKVSGFEMRYGLDDGAVRFGESEIRPASGE